MNKKINYVGEEPKTEQSNMKKRDKTESNFELVLLAAQRCRQLVNGADPRISVLNKKTRNTYIAVKEVELGLIVFNGNYDE